VFLRYSPDIPGALNKIFPLCSSMLLLFLKYQLEKPNAASSMPMSTRDREKTAAGVEERKPRRLPRFHEKAFNIISEFFIERKED